jgi:transposase
MYLKVTRAKEHEYLKIVESYRDKEDGKIKHRVLFNLGRLDNLIKHTSLIDKLVEKLGQGRYVKIDDINQDGDAKVYNYGYIVIRELWNRYKLDDFFKEVLKKRASKSIDRIIHTIFSLVINRALYYEASKLGYYKEKDYFLFVNETVKLHHLYETLEDLESLKDDLEKHLFKINQSLFNQELSVAFYDVTTLYFESKIEDNDDENGEKGLRKFGLSKDFKINETQIVLSLLIDANGMPITFEIYEGNRAETTTLLDTLDSLKKRFGIQKVTVVADRGISKWLNLAEIKARGYEYIVAVSIKQDKELIKKVLDKSDYNQISFDEKNGYYGYKAFELTKSKRTKVYPGYSCYKESDQEYCYSNITLTHKIVATYSDKRAKKDEKDRNRAIEKLEKRIKIGQALKKSKYLKATSNDCSTDFEIDLQKVEEDRKFDGFYALASSDLSIEPLKVIEIHKTIYDIENAFRDIKHSLSIRPIYHFKKERIKGHIIVSFLAYLFLKHIEYRLKKSQKVQKWMQKEDETLSIKKIIKALHSMSVTQTTIQNDTFFIRHQHDTIASKIVDLFKIKLPSNLIEKEKMRLYLAL